MRKLVLGVVALATLVTAPAVAADLRARPAPVYKSAPITPYYSWTGCYLGGNVGGAWSYKSFDDPNGVYSRISPARISAGIRRAGSPAVRRSAATTRSAPG